MTKFLQRFYPLDLQQQKKVNNISQKLNNPVSTLITMEAEKHSLEEEQEEWIGPLPTEDSSQPQKKKQKILMHEKLYLDR